MRSAEAQCAAAWRAWRDSQDAFGVTHRVYGVAMHSAGDTHFQTAPSGAIEVVTGGGLLARPATRADLALLDRCVADGNFMVCVQHRRRGPANPVLRVHPGRDEGWSVKSLHPARGGLGTVSATVIR